MTADLPLISIIIPAYNTAPYLKRCVSSVLEQTYPKELMEIIIVDDGSTDDTGKVADEITSRESRVLVIHQENKGLSGARNSGILKASGEFIGFVDSDDYITPGMYETLVLLILRYNVKIAQIGRTEISEDGVVLPDIVKVPEKDELRDAKAFLKELLMHEGDASFCTKLTAKSLFSDGFLFPTDRLNEDFLLLSKMLTKVSQIAIARERGYFVYYRKGSLTRNKSDEESTLPPSYIDIIKNADEVSAMVCELYPELSDVAMRFGLVQRLDYLLHVPITMMNGKNETYVNAAKYLKAHRNDIRANPYLSDKDRKNLLILSYGPKAARRAHAGLKKNILLTLISLTAEFKERTTI